MKSTKLMAIGTLVLFGISGAGAQSLGDYARAARKNKPEPSGATRHFDNDNLPTNETLSVVGPPPDSDAKSAPAAKPDAVAPGGAAADRQKTAADWQSKLDQQKAKIDSLNHDLDLDQRELRLRAAAMYSNPGVTVRTTQWDKDETVYRSDIEAKQKALDAARQDLDQMQEQAQKAGVVEKDKDRDNTSDKK
jgi:hypothetical protein